jgi:protoheme ferro-lyase
VRGTFVAPWLGLLAGSIAFGACLVGALVAPRRSLFIAVAGMSGGVVLVIRMFSAIARSTNAEAIGLAIFFVAAGVAGGYWSAAAALPHAIPRQRHLESATSAIHPDRPAVAILSCAEAPRYRIASTARVIERLVTSGALRLPASTLPFVFLSEKTRYHALGGYNPARATTSAVAEEATRELDGLISNVAIAWCDGSPSLAEVIDELGQMGHRDAVLVTVGPDDSFRSLEPLHEAQRAADSVGIRLVRAPSIWRSDVLASRLVDRIIELTNSATLDDVGVVLVGEGEPPAWSEAEGGWLEHENYFNQRVRLMLVERGIRESNIRIGWLEWETPDVTETTRHLAALGCRRIIIAPATLPHITLASALDLKHAVDSARLGDDVRVVTMTPWGDDRAMVRATADAIRASLQLLEP